MYNDACNAMVKHVLERCMQQRDAPVCPSRTISHQRALPPGSLGGPSHHHPEGVPHKVLMCNCIARVDACADVLR